MRFLWPALTQLPRVLPRLRELRLGGGVAAATTDHVLRCWAGASGDPDSLATPMVIDPAFNAMMRPPQRRDASGAAAGAGAEVAAAAAGPNGWNTGHDAAPAGAGRAVPWGGGSGAVTARQGRDADGPSCSEWRVSLERVCLLAPGPTVAGALHLRRFMPGLRRLQVVVEGRLTDVVVAAGR
ncbi:hypothetical protein GPECTOR_1g647 [Gonium pectorale]|uniref:Uncharacterized protein n=1 Tax=Gonium pectorale TaxID=33097 RepID=A0A150H4G0_GONPE|nr:hypothetical protein GPECTOR_1g647 [Gonium pectorale]|eukprot:KXZ56718.1 hypothetical protein GPECTOR_1g647 [Gonium pectorale]